MKNRKEKAKDNFVSDIKQAKQPWSFDVTQKPTNQNYEGERKLKGSLHLAIQYTLLPTNLK